ncbi:MAG: hypothetical protein AAF503_07460, partial [Pseudomonadota bacterium]
GQHATKNYIDLTDAQFDPYVDRKDLQIDAKQAGHCSGVGYVLVRYKGLTMGLGVYRPDAEKGGGLIENMFPKRMSPIRRRTVRSA